MKYMKNGICWLFCNIIVTIIVSLTSSISILMLNDSVLKYVCLLKYKNIIISHAFWCAIVGFIYFAIRELILFFKYKRIEEKNSELSRIKDNIQIFFEGQLFNISSQYNFTNKCSERITLYLHTNIDNNELFTQVARYSPNPEFRKKGRGNYPKKKGVIAEAWKNSLCRISVKNPSEYPSDKLYGLTQEEINDMKMKSKLIVGRKIIYNNSSPNVDLGVVILESTDYNWKKNKELDELISDEDIELLADLMNKFKDYIPTHETASIEKGF